MVLVDGGVRDNLAVSWFDLGPEVDELIVVSAAANRHSLRLITQLVGLTELGALLNAVNIPYNTRERNRRRAVAAQLFGTAWAKSKDGAKGALVHIEDSPYDLARKLVAKASGANKAGTWLDSTTRPDWEIDQRLIVEQLWAAAGDRPNVLADRAKAVLKHLELLESCLPDPPELSQWDLIALHAATIMRTPSDVTLGSDPERAWWRRAQQSALVGTKLSRIRADEAMNLIVHGYYLAMANLHICAGWPLFNALNQERLEKLFQDVPKKVSTTEIQAKLLVDELKAAKAQTLQLVYPVLNLFSISVKVRQTGQFEHKDAIVGLAIDSQGRFELVGIWIAPTWLDLPPGQKDNLLGRFEGLKKLRADSWRSLFTDLKGRGIQNIAISFRDLYTERWLSKEEFLGCDEAILTEYPHLFLLPRVSALISDSNRWLQEGRDDSNRMRSELEAIFRAPTEMAGKERLDQLGAKGEKYAEIATRWTPAWNGIAPFFDFSKETRELFLQIDSIIDTIQTTLKDNSRKRNIASNDEIALSGVYRDLKSVKRKQKRLDDWPRHQPRLDRELQTALSRRTDLGSPESSDSIPV